jgi:hypothetical protein
MTSYNVKTSVWSHQLEELIQIFNAPYSELILPMLSGFNPVKSGLNKNDQHQGVPIGHLTNINNKTTLT